MVRRIGLLVAAVAGLALAACGADPTDPEGLREVAAEGPATADALLVEAFGAVPDIPGGTGRTGTWFDRVKGAARTGTERFVDPPTRQELEEVGAATVEQMKAAMPACEDAAVRGRVVGILRRLLLARPRDSRQEYRFEILSSDVANAFMSAGGRGVVLEGLARILADDSQLAFILAHEVAHGELGHLDEKVHAAKVGWELGRKIEARTGSESEEASKLLAAVTQKVLSSTYDQDQEFEADRMGLALMIRAGFDPAAAPAALRAISGAERPAPTGGLRRVAYDVVGTHPPTADRVAFLERLVEAHRTAAGR